MSLNDRPYTHILCTSCATIVPTDPGALPTCNVCGEQLESPADSTIYRYAEAAIYYGYQYRMLFERQQASPTSTKFSLSFIGEAFTFVAIAAISGVIGNFAYDVIKAALVRIRDQAREQEANGSDYVALGELTDADLDRIYDYSKSFVEGLKDIEKTIRDDIFEEMVADHVANALANNQELFKLLGKKKISAKERDKMKKAFYQASRTKPHVLKPRKAKLKGFWSKVKNNGVRAN